MSLQIPQERGGTALQESTEVLVQDPQNPVSFNSQLQVVNPNDNMASQEEKQTTNQEKKDSFREKQKLRWALKKRF